LSGAQSGAAKPSKAAMAAALATEDEIARVMSQGVERAKGCSSTGSPTGTAQVSVTFAPSGDVTGAIVRGAAFANTVEGDCISVKFRSLHVTPFTGDSITSRRSITFQ
jgi:hypothetical protein